jgi:hypothetical protein
MSAVSATLDEARESLRVIRQTMERSTQYSTLSGWSGILIGLVAIVGVLITRQMQTDAVVRHIPDSVADMRLAGLWFGALVLAVSIDFVCNKRRARRVGKYVMSRLGAHILLAAMPSFLGAAILTIFFFLHGLAPFVWGVWMLCYGLAICAVGLFSVKPVSILGAAFVISGALTLLLPAAYHLPMMALAFGGFHIVYGVAMARKHGW